MTEMDEPEVLRAMKRGLPGREIADAFVLKNVLGTDVLAAISRLAAD